MLGGDSASEYPSLSKNCGSTGLLIPRSMPKNGLKCVGAGICGANARRASGAIRPRVLDGGKEVAHDRRPSLRFRTPRLEPARPLSCLAKVQKAERFSGMGPPNLRPPPRAALRPYDLQLDKTARPGYCAVLTMSAYRRIGTQFQSTTFAQWSAAASGLRRAATVTLVVDCFAPAPTTDERK